MSVYDHVAERRERNEAETLANLYKERMNELMGIKEEDALWNLAAIGFTLAGMPWIGLGIDAVGSVKSSYETSQVEDQYAANDFLYTSNQVEGEYETGLMDAKTELQVSLWSSLAMNAANTYTDSDIGGIDEVTGEEITLGNELSGEWDKVKEAIPDVKMNWGPNPSFNPYPSGPTPGGRTFVKPWTGRGNV